VFEKRPDLKGRDARVLGNYAGDGKHSMARKETPVKSALTGAPKEVLNHATQFRILTIGTEEKVEVQGGGGEGQQK